MFFLAIVCWVEEVEIVFFDKGFSSGGVDRDSSSGESGGRLHLELWLTKSKEEAAELVVLVVLIDPWTLELGWRLSSSVMARGMTMARASVGTSSQTFPSRASPSSVSSSVSNPRRLFKLTPLESSPPLKLPFSREFRLPSEILRRLNLNLEANPDSFSRLAPAEIQGGM